MNTIAPETAAAEREVAARDALLIEAGTRLLAAARIAEAVAERHAGRLGTFALLGVLAAAWLTWRLASYFELSLISAGLTLFAWTLPALVLAKLQAMLRGAIGLPQRLVGTLAELQGKYHDFRQLAEQPPAVRARPKLSELRKLGRAMLEIRSLGKRARGLVAEVGGSIAIANPLFLIVLLVSMLAVGAVTAIAALSALIYLL
jgi:hypothetical protein